MIKTVSNRNVIIFQLRPLKMTKDLENQYLETMKTAVIDAIEDI